MMLKKVFNPNLIIVFLHTPSVKILIQVFFYEVSAIKCLHLFLSIKETSACYCWKGYEYERLQNIGGYISKIQVEELFLIETLLALTQKALKNITYICYGCSDCSQRQDYKKENVS
jgi:hypothetical protein